ncbi:MAG: magnesium transporter, partial [Epsilonproteobacteria bacterium]|nr:magnesium transporter [Campylobacterota bacterium]
MKLFKVKDGYLVEEKVDVLDLNKPIHQVFFTHVSNQKLRSWLFENDFPEQIIEDITNEDQTPVFDIIPNGNVTILKHLRFSGEEYLDFDTANIAIIKIKNKLIIACDEDEAVVEISKKFERRMSRHKTDIIFEIYTIFDIIMDNSIFMSDIIDVSLEELEDHIMNESIDEKIVQEKIYYARRTLNRLVKLFIQENEVVNKFFNSVSPTKKKKLKYEFSDLKEHILFLVKENRTLLDRTGYLLNFHMGIMSNRMNAAMQRLTAITIIFLPLTFIVGNYGMNFKYMPELQWKYGYLFAIVL